VGEKYLFGLGPVALADFYRFILILKIIFLIILYIIIFQFPACPYFETLSLPTGTFSVLDIIFVEKTLLFQDGLVIYNVSCSGSSHK